MEALLQEPRKFSELPEEDRLALLDLLVEQGILDTKGYVTPLGEQYILSGYISDQDQVDEG